jgi:hypothetical protein
MFKLFNNKIIFILLVIYSTQSLARDTVELLPKEFYAVGFRLNIDASIDDKSGVYEARVYFKGSKSKEYRVYATMKCKNGDCKATLPAPVGNNIYYKILYQNYHRKIFVTEEFSMEKRDMLQLEDYQIRDKSEMILGTDFLKPPKTIVGFKDINLKVKTIDNREKIGVLAKIIDKNSAGIQDTKEIDGEFGGTIGTVGEERSILTIIAGVALLFAIL